MTMRAPRAPALLLAIAMLAAACGSGAGTATTGPATDAPATASATTAATDAMTAEPGMTEPAMTAEPGMTEPGMTEPGMTAEPSAGEPPPNAAAEALQMHPWATATLTDVTTGETFTIAQLAGKPIFIESMAIWCSNCRAQQARFAEAFGRMAPGTAEYVVLTIDPAETAEDLARYKAERGFTGRYAVAGRDVSRALEAEFGPNAINPPSVPLVFVSAAGEVSFGTGGESVDEILVAVGA